MKYYPLITCEHAGNEVPEEYLNLFFDREALLNSHRGWDPGAFHTAEYLAENLNSLLFSCHTTRLLIETNRSAQSAELFSECSLVLDVTQREKLVRNIYEPHRMGIERQIAESEKPVLHLAVHSFTPSWNGTLREVDIGLLFDPGRKAEAAFCDAWKTRLEQLSPFTIRFNEPYLGIDDGLTTYLRSRFPDPEYLGIEIEINQRFVGKKELNTVQSVLLNSLLEITF